MVIFPLDPFVCVYVAKFSLSDLIPAKTVKKRFKSKTDTEYREFVAVDVLLQGQANNSTDLFHVGSRILSLDPN